MLADIEANLLAGRSGVSLVTRFSTDDYPSQIAGAARRFPARRAATCDFSARPAGTTGPWCVESALRDAGLWGEHRALRVGLVLGSAPMDAALGGRPPAWRHAGLRSRSGPRLDDRADPARLDLSGPALALSAACASGNHAFEIGRHWLQRGWSTSAWRGPATWPSRRSVWRPSATFAPVAAERRPSRGVAPLRPRPRRLRAGRGGRGVRPGAGARRPAAGGHAYAEVAGCGASSDAHHHVIPSPDPAPAAAADAPGSGRCAGRARRGRPRQRPCHEHPGRRRRRGRRPSLGLGDDAGRIPVSSTKSLTGHLLTAAGAFEALACLTALRHQAIPPTINLDEPDVDLCLVANEARPHRVRIAVSNSFGFGGSNTCLVLRAV